MKRFGFFCIVLAAALGGLYRSERRTKSSPVSANALVNMAADAQRDVLRIPLHFTHLSDEEEIRIGNELANGYAMKDGKLTAEEQALQRYVQRVGGAVAVHAHRHLPYRFHILPNRDVINAFSLPGGHVYVGSGLLDLMQTEDEMANVLGHEIEHIDHYHCSERVQVEARLKDLHLEVAGEVLQIPIELWEAGYSKDEEFEADREGMQIAVRAGYSPFGSVSAFEQLAKLQREYEVRAQTPEEEISELARQSLEGYLRSHPLSSERIAQANRIIAQEHWEDRKTQRPFRLEYEIHTGATAK